MTRHDWDPVDADGCRPASRAAKLLRAIQRAVAAHDAEAAAPPGGVAETRVEFDSPEAARVLRLCRAPDGTEHREVVHVAFDRDDGPDGRWRVVSVEPG